MKGLCKDEFKKWYNDPLREKVALHRSIRHFETYTPSMQIGVLIDYFDSVGIEIVILMWYCNDINKNYFQVDINYECVGDYINSRKEAWDIGKDKACELRNKQLLTITK